MSLLSRLFAIKSLEMLDKEAHGDNRLRRVLGPIGLTSLGVGAIIGAGIFVMTGEMAAKPAGAGWKHLKKLLDARKSPQTQPYLCSDPFSTPGAWFNLPAVLVLGFCTIVLVIGIRESAMSNTIMVMIKLGVVLFVIVVGAFF